MLEQLHLKNVGPSPEMEMEFAPRLNLITGDNGLGKSFLLDVVWWALTRKWPQDLNRKLTSGYAARPSDVKKAASIDFRLTSKTKSVSYSSRYSTRDEAWTGKAGRPWNPGLVIYAHADGGFSVWDPARNYWKKRGNVDIQEKLPGYVFSPKEVWDGLELDVEGKQTIVCNGLIRDWANWILANGQSAKNMAEVLRRLSPSDDKYDLLLPGPLTRLPGDDVRDIPSVKTAYAGEVPILHSSSGIRRIVAVAYMLLWSWTEHAMAARRLGEPQASQVVMIIDELESHLHPRWQRTILHAVLQLTAILHKEASIQLIAATHSPLVLASAEAWFDPRQDAWFDLDLERTAGAAFARLRKREYVRHGEISNWLTSEAFDLKSARSIEGEKAVQRAMELLRRVKPIDENEAKEADDALRQAGLPDIDSFWVRWGKFMESFKA